MRVYKGDGPALMQGPNGGVAMTRTSKEHPAPVPGEPESPGGRAAERLDEFTQARGLGDEEVAAQPAHPREAERRDVSWLPRYSWLPCHSTATSRSLTLSAL